MDDNAIYDFGMYDDILEFRRMNKNNYYLSDGMNSYDGHKSTDVVKLFTNTKILDKCTKNDKWNFNNYFCKNLYNLFHAKLNNEFPNTTIKDIEGVAYYARNVHNKKYCLFGYEDMHLVDNSVAATIKDYKCIKQKDKRNYNNKMNY
jgi:hypothetical protein